MIQQNSSQIFELKIFEIESTVKTNGSHSSIYAILTSNRFQLWKYLHRLSWSNRKHVIECAA